MKLIFFLIGLVLIAGGINAVKNPRTSIVPMGGNRYNPTTTYQPVPVQGSRYMGYTSIGLGACSIMIALSAKSLFTGSMKPKRKQN